MIITTISGRAIDTAQVELDTTTQHFTYASEDITNDLFRSDKTTFDGFDVTKDNDRISREKYARQHGGQAAPATGSTSTLDIFANQILTDPLAAPIEAVDNAVAKITASSGLKTVAIVAALIIAAAIYFKER